MIYKNVLGKTQAEVKEKLATGVIQIKRQVARINGEVVEAPQKTKNSCRTLSIGVDAVEILKEQQSKVKGEYVFPSPNGGTISPDSVLHMLHRVLDRAGLPRLRFHDGGVKIGLNQ